MSEAIKDKFIAINVSLASRIYRLRINAADEQMVRKAVKLADDKISSYRSQYAGKDMQDFMAMCLLSYAIDSATAALNDPLLLDALAEMNAKIEKSLE
jgi:Cell division protein ZapA